jgi:hypothetical protein
MGRDQKWNPDGTITVTGDPNFRMGIIELPVLLGIVSKLEQVVGPKIHTLFMEASCKYTRRYVDNLLKGPLMGFVVRKTRTGAKLAYTKLIDTAGALGFGRIEFKGHEYRKKIHGTIYNPYYLPLFLGDVRGSFESLEEYPSEVEWEEEGNLVHVTVTRKDTKSGFKDRFLTREETRVPGDIEYRNCKRCGVPVSLKRFKWKTDKGIIIDTATGDRVVIMGLNDLTSVIMELEKSIGIEVSKALYDMNREYGSSLVKRGWIKNYEDLARDLRLKGMTNLSFSEKDGVSSYICRNSFNNHYLMGRCVGVFEEIEKKQVEPSTTDDGGVLEITM